jgi:hypothetical protein
MKQHLRPSEVRVPAGPRIPEINASVITSQPWCDTCLAIPRKPRGGWPCPVCKRPILSTEQRNEPNHLLYRHWRAVFRQIPQFDRCICLRRVRCPDRSGDVDFLLLQPRPHPRLGLVEVEGWDVRKNTPHDARHGIDQLSRYLKAFRGHAGDGSTILRESIGDAFDTEKHNNQRGQTNVRKLGSYARWARALGDVHDDAQLARLLGSASQQLVPILLVFRPRSHRGAVLTEKELDHLAKVLPVHRPYVGAVAWPSADMLLARRCPSQTRQR